jgi:hypothetical protein
MPADKRVIDYRISVAGLTVDGHPFQVVSQTFGDLHGIMGKLAARYPDHDVELYQTTEQLIGVFKKRDRADLDFCPRGHSGEADGKSIVVKIGDHYYCNVCGDFF